MIDELHVPFQLPNGWARAPLGELCHKITDGTHITPQYVSRGVPFVSTTNLVPFGKDFDFSNYEKFITLDEHLMLKKRVSPAKGDILVSKCGTIGRAQVVSVDYEFSIFVGLALLKVNHNLISSKFLECLLNSAAMRKELERLSPGSTRKTLTINAINKVQIPLPPLPEQSRIVAKIEELFSFLDAGVKSLRKVKAQLKHYRQAVLKYAFEGKLTEESRKVHRDQIEPATKLLERIRQERKKDPKYKEPPPIDESDLPKISEKWVWTTIGSLFDVGSGGTPSRRKPEYWNGNIPWVSSGEVAFCEVRSTNEYITKEGLENSSAKLYPTGTVLMALYGEGKTRGQAAILRITATTNQAVACILCANSPMPPEYVYWWLCYRYYETRRIREGANQPNMYLHHVRKMTIPVAPLLEQKEIIQKIEESLSVADEIDRTVDTSLLQAERLRQCILKTAFEGKLVPQDAGDEPAEKLLERMKDEGARSEGENDINRRKNKPKQLELSAYVK